MPKILDITAMGGTSGGSIKVINSAHANDPGAPTGTLGPVGPTSDTSAAFQVNAAVKIWVHFVSEPPDPAKTYTIEYEIN